MCVVGLASLMFGYVVLVRMALRSGCGVFRPSRQVQRHRMLSDVKAAWSKSVSLSPLAAR